MRKIEEIKDTLGRFKREKLNAKTMMEKALIDQSEFAYNVHSGDVKKFEYYIEILEYVLGERE